MQRRGLAAALAALGPSGGALAAARQLLPALTERWTRAYSAAEPERAAGDAIPDTFRAADLVVERSAVRQPPVNLEDIKFGTVFTDHMFLTEHEAGRGWGAPALRPLGLLQLHPASQVLHYGMTCFEGLKAYHGVDGRMRLFRPDMNMARLRRSAHRLQLADFCPQELLACLKRLLLLDRGWLPAREGFSLYIRPFAFSSAGVLGVAKPSRTTLSILMSPVGPYFPSGLRPIPLFVDEHNRRAWPGGAGDCKLGGNYAPTIQPQVEAAARYGAPQVLYTLRESSQHPDDGEFEEAGAMNLFFLLARPDGGRVLATPRLSGTILPGVTRDSILALARAWGECEVEERAVTIGEVRAAAAEGRLLEVFGSGTACVVQPVGALIRANGEVFRPSLTGSEEGLAGGGAVGGPPALCVRLLRALGDIQYGRTAHPWGVVVE